MTNAVQTKIVHNNSVCLPLASLPGLFSSLPALYRFKHMQPIFSFFPTRVVNAANGAHQVNAVWEKPSLSNCACTEAVQSHRAVLHSFVQLTSSTCMLSCQEVHPSHNIALYSTLHLHPCCIVLVSPGTERQRRGQCISTKVHASRRIQFALSEYHASSFTPSSCLHPSRQGNMN